MNEDFITSSLPSQEQVEQEKSPELQAIEASQNQDDYNLAALSDHPGWKQIEEKMRADIDDLRSGKSIAVAKYTNEELGEVFRTDRIAADKLEEYVNKVSNAVKAVVMSNAQRRE